MKSLLLLASVSLISINSFAVAPEPLSCRHDLAANTYQINCGHYGPGKGNILLKHEDDGSLSIQYTTDSIRQHPVEYTQYTYEGKTAEGHHFVRNEKQPEWVPYGQGPADILIPLNFIPPDQEETEADVIVKTFYNYDKVSEPTKWHCQYQVQVEIPIPWVKP